jgi:hypothetical protein
MDHLRRIETLFKRIKNMTSLRLALAIGAIFEAVVIILFAVFGIDWSARGRTPITDFGMIIAYIQAPGLWVVLSASFPPLPGTIGLFIMLILIIGLNFLCAGTIAYGIIYLVRWLRAGAVPHSRD